MTERDTSHNKPARGTLPASPEVWLEQVAAGLPAAGLRVQVAEAAGEAFLTGCVSRPGRRETEVTVDADGYCEVRWWLDPGIPPGEAAEVIAAALAAVHVPAVRAMTHPNPLGPLERVGAVEGAELAAASDRGDSRRACSPPRSQGPGPPGALASS